MRFKLIVELADNKIPIEYRNLIISYIKNGISKCNEGKYYDSFFKDNTRKDYSFTVILPKSKFCNNEIILEKNEIQILFTTSDSNKTGFILFNAFIGQKNKSYPLPNNNSMTLKSIVMQKQEVITNSRAIFKTVLGSGVCVREHDRQTNKDKYYVYNDECYREKLKIVVDNQLLKAGFSKNEINEVKFNFFNCKKVVIKHYRRYIDTTVGNLEISANNEILQFIYDVGLGSRVSAGFGFLELITQDLV